MKSEELATARFCRVLTSAAFRYARTSWRQTILHSSFFTFFATLFLLSSCGVDSDRFRLEGRLRNMNQGEFWIYSTDGGASGIDTIFVRDGRFEYETTLRIPSTYVLIFPNFSELPIFANPGKVATIKGDASHLKEITIKGTSDNEEMTKLRMELNKLMPPEIPGAVEKFIRNNPESQVSSYLLLRYFMMDQEADYGKAYELATLMAKEQPDNGRLLVWKKMLEGLRYNKKDSKLPTFSAVDIKGRRVTQDQLKGKVNVVSLWATWNYTSTDIQHRLQQAKKKYGEKLGLLSICLDGRPAECRNKVNRDSINWPNVCDGKMWQSPLVMKLGLTDVPANLLVNDKGVVIERNLAPQQLEEKINQLLK